MSKKIKVVAGTAASLAATVGGIGIAAPVHASTPVGKDGDMSFQITGSGAYVSHMTSIMLYGCHAGHFAVTGPNNYLKNSAEDSCWGGNKAFDIDQHSDVVTGQYCSRFWQQNGSGGYFVKYFVCWDVWN